VADHSLGESFSWWYAKVVDVNDPKQSGRVRVRVYGHHDDETNIPDADLPWTLPIQPVSSAAIGKIGTAPVGLVPGSIVVGFWSDSSRRYPIIWGSIGKAGDIIPGSTENGAPRIDPVYGSIPGSAQGIPNNPYAAIASTRQLLTDNIFSTSSSKGVVITNEVKKGMLNAKTPTTASADKTDKSDIIDLIKSIDPTFSNASLKCLNLSFFNIKNLLSLAAGIVGSIAGQLKNLFLSAMQNAILTLAKKLGVFKVLAAINAAANAIKEVANLINALNIQVCGSNLFNQKGFDAVNGLMAETVHGLNTLTAGINYALVAPTAVANNLFDNLITAPLASVATSSTPVPPSISILPPSNYVQQYSSSDPFPGFLTFADPSGIGANVYTPRNGQPNYTSATQHILFETQNNILSNLESKILGGDLGPRGLTSLFSGSSAFAQAFAAKKVFGEGFAIGGAALLITSIAGKTGSALRDLGVDIGTVSSVQPSLLSSSTVSSAVNKFVTSQTLLNSQRFNAKIGVGGY